MSVKGEMQCLTNGAFCIHTPAEHNNMTPPIVSQYIRVQGNIPSAHGLLNTALNACPTVIPTSVSQSCPNMSVSPSSSPLCPAEHSRSSIAAIEASGVRAFITEVVCGLRRASHARCVRTPSRRMRCTFRESANKSSPFRPFASSVRYWAHASRQMLVQAKSPPLMSY